MSALRQLLRSFIAGGIVARILTLLGLIFLLIAPLTMTLGHYWWYWNPLYHSASPVLQTFLYLPAWLAMLFLFGGTVGMPEVMMRLACSRRLAVVPHGRFYLLLSGMLVVTGMSLVAASLAYLALRDLPLDLPPVFLNTLAGGLPTYTLTYIIICLIGIYRSPLFLFAGILLSLFCLSMPVQLSEMGYFSVRLMLLLSLVMWILMSVLIVHAARVREWLVSREQRGYTVRENSLPAKTAHSGISQLLGLDRSGRWAATSVLPALAAGLYIESLESWLLFFVLMAAITGALTCFLPGRCRRLWLRLDGDRNALFRLAESACWRHHRLPLAVLTLLFLGLGGSLEKGWEMMLGGLPLLLLAATAGTYLGLLMTREIGWREFLLTLVAGALILAASYALLVQPLEWIGFSASCATLLLLSLLFRRQAKLRWERLDWRLC